MPPDVSQQLRGKTIILVNTGSQKKKFTIQRLKKLGLTVVALNKEKNWAVNYVDHWILADTSNHTEAMLRVDEFLSTHRDIVIDGALTFWEDDVLLTSKIIDKYNLTGIPHTKAKQIRNKFKFREFCRLNNLPTPNYALINSLEDIHTTVQALTFPLVIKPVYGSSSAFVIKVEREEELVKVYKYIEKSLSTTIESALSNGLQIMVEEYIVGDEVDIDILLQNGKMKFFCVTDNNPTREPFFVETGQSIPSNLPAPDQEALISTAEDILEKAGIQDGCIHFEAKHTKSGPVPVEVNLRMGGDTVHSFVKTAWDVDLIEYAALIACGIHFPKIKLPALPKKHVIARHFLPDYSGILVQIEIPKTLAKNKDIHEIYFPKNIGDAVFIPPDGYEDMGWITVTGDNFIDAQNNIEKYVKEVHFDVAKFHSASSFGKTTRQKTLAYSALNKEFIARRGKIEKIRQMSILNQRNLHIGIACNLYEEHDGIMEYALTSVGRNIQNALEARGYKISLFDFNRLHETFNALKDSDVDLVFNVGERINNSSLLEPHVTALLDALQLPYTGSNPSTLSTCIDKIRVKKLLTYHSIPTPAWDYAYHRDDDIREDLKFPLMVKPANTDNSIGITNESVVTNEKDFKKQLELVLEGYKRPALVEEYIEGDEYDVSILGTEEDDLRILPLSRAIFDNMPEGYWHIYPFEAKWGNDTTYQDSIVVQRPAKNISGKLSALLSEIALDTYNILHCHDYGKVEIRVDKNGNPYVLELNPNASINTNDCIPSVAALIGMDYADFIEEIIRLAIKRYQTHPPYYHLQPNIL